MEPLSLGWASVEVWSCNTIWKGASISHPETTISRCSSLQQDVRLHSTAERVSPTHNWESDLCSRCRCRPQKCTASKELEPHAWIPRISLVWSCVPSRLSGPLTGQWIFEGISKIIIFKTRVNYARLSLVQCMSVCLCVCMHACVCEAWWWSGSLKEEQKLTQKVERKAK